MLFDPFEKEFHLPTAFVELGNGQRGEDKVVRQQYQPFVRLGVEIADAANWIGVLLRRFGTVEEDRLVASQPCCFVDRAVGTSAVIEIFLGANDKKG